MRQQAIAISSAVRPGLKNPAGNERVFAFDLDGTITSREMLPLIARHAGLEKELADLTRRTLLGEIDFATSFRERFSMLRDIPLAAIHETVASVPLDPHIEAFIADKRDACVIVTGNLDMWVQPLLRRLGCRWFASRGAVIRNRLSLLSVLHKGAAAAALLREGKEIIAVGESVNDVPLFRAAALGIAFAGVHAPVPEVRRLARFRVKDGKSLCRLLRGLPHSLTAGKAGLS